MLLAIDSGNTNVVFAVHDGREWRASWRAHTDVKRTADEYAVWLTQLMQLKDIQLRDITGAIISNVVPATLFNLKTLCRRYFGCDPLVVGEAGIDLGLRIVMDRPEDVGADRLVNAVAAHASYGGPLIIIDFGTATTFDIVDQEGNYAGGVIAPGINLSLEALYMAAAKLPRVAIERPPRVIGKATVPGMQSGIFWGYVGLMEGLVKRIQAEFGAPMKVVATGGLAALFADATDAIERTDADLTLRGLLQIYNQNQKA